MRGLRFLTVAFFVMSSGGCARSHDVGDASPRDAASDGSLVCAAATPAVFCTEGPIAIPTGATSLDVVVTGDCLSACASIACDAAIVGPSELSFHVRTCVEAGTACPPVCVTSLRGSCALPPLTDGSWQVTVNGDYGFLASVSSVDLPYRDVCWTPASPAAPAFQCGDPSPLPTSDQAVCRAVVAQAREPIVVEVVDECADCFEVSGGCRVDVAGDTITLSADHRTCECPVCGACAPICVENVVRCVVPPLEVGTYDLVAGTIFTDLVVGATSDDSRRCTRVITP